MSDELQKEDITFHCQRSNHKSAQKHHNILDKIINEDIEKGFALPLPINILYDILNALLAPLRCIEQDTINELGERIPKFRMTHDQSFLGPSSLSVNH